jgi:hypothetical protein
MSSAFGNCLFLQYTKTIKQKTMTNTISNKETIQGLLGGDLITIQNLISKSNLDDIRYIMEIVAERKKFITSQNKYQCKIGDTVFINHMKLNGIPCRVEKINRTKIVVKADTGIRYNVSPLLINF